MIHADDIITFWFVEHSAKDWFGADLLFDQELRERFLDLHAEVAAGEKSSWRQTAKGRLAEILVLDQFSRQFFRGQAKAFATDSMALVLAQELVSKGWDQELDATQRQFAYMPYMHSESLVVHREAALLYEAIGDPNLLKFEMAHFEVIQTYGRFPKRNAALERESTPEEIMYMKENSGMF